MRVSHKLDPQRDLTGTYQLAPASDTLLSLAAAVLAALESAPSQALLINL